MNLEFFHQATFFVLYLGAAIVTFVLVERAIYYLAAARDTERLLAGEDIGGGGPVVELARALTDPRLKTLSRTAFEDTTESVYLRARSGLKARLWLFDTIVTAAPLVGLLGTILGIIDTFVALARSGISDPAAVSAGIGTALYATALGIALALYSLLSLNFFRERLARLSDRFKDMILRGPYHGDWHVDTSSNIAVANAAA